METLKIAFYTDSYLPSRDGVVTSIQNTKEELEKRGHEVYIFASGNKETEKIAKKQKNLFIIKGIRFSKYPQYTFGLMAKESMRIMDINPDIIHAHTPFSAGLFGYRANIQLNKTFISTFHTMIFSDEVISSYFTNNKMAVKASKFVITRYLKWFYSRTDKTIAPTEYVKKILNKVGLDNVYVVPTGINFSSMNLKRKSIARAHLKMASKDKVLLYFGRVSKEKNIDILIRSARLLANNGFKVIIAGYGPYLNEISQLNKKLGNKNVIFTGFVKDEDIAYYYSAADILCNPSLFETQGLVNLYAAFYKVPILMAKDSAQEELLNYSKCGEVFDAKSIKSLSEKAVEVYNNKESYSFDKIVKEFDIRKTVNKLLSLYIN